MPTQEKDAKNKYDQRLITDIKEYVEKRIKLFSLTVAEQVSLMITLTVQKIVGLAFLTVAMLFVCFSLAYLIGEWLNSISAGFAIISLPMFIIGLIFFKKKSTRFTEHFQARLIEKTIYRFDKDDENSSSGSSS